MAGQIREPTLDTRDRVKAAVPTSVDVAIIGAGMGGLTAGAYLAKAGVKVAVFDSHYVAGGCATMFSRGTSERRYHFDIGLHYIGDCEPGGNIPRLLEGVGAEVSFEEMDPDGFDTIVLPELEFRIPRGREAYRERLVETFPSERRGIDRYVRLLAEVEGFVDLSRCELVDTAQLDSPLPTPTPHAFALRDGARAVRDAVARLRGAGDAVERPVDGNRAKAEVVCRGCVASIHRPLGRGCRGRGDKDGPRSSLD